MLADCVLEEGKKVKGDLVITLVAVLGYPFIVPIANKGPLSASKSRRNHPIELYATGLSLGKVNNLNYKKWNPDACTFWLNLWVINATMM